MYLNAATRLALVGVFLSSLAYAADAEKDVAGQADWPNWRGPSHNGVSLEKGWRTDWSANPPKQLWTAKLGYGFSSVAVSGGKVYTMGNNGKQDTVFCLEADTGKEVWKQSRQCTTKENYPGSRSTPTVDGKMLYTLGMDGQAFCFEAATSKVVWNKDYYTDLKPVVPLHKFACSPIVDGELILLNMGSEGLAVEKKTGNVVWKSVGEGSYTSVVPFTQGGKHYAALFAGTQLIVLDPATGNKIASAAWKTKNNESAPDPVIYGGKIFITSGPEGSCGLFELAGDKLNKVWENKNLSSYFASPVIVGDYVWGFNKNKNWEGWKSDLVCLSLKDGSLQWTQKDVQSGGIMVADGKLLILTYNGDLILAEASSAAYKEIGRTKALPDKPKETFTAGPVLCDGRIYVRSDNGTLICLDVKAN
jgi:outer membrane protein assembly factor BamB